MEISMQTAAAVKTAIDNHSIEVATNTAASGTQKINSKANEAFETGLKCFRQYLDNENTSEEILFSSIKALKTAVKLKHPDAQYRLGIVYLYHNHFKAFKLFETASKLGHANAQIELAICYIDGKGTEQDIEKAFKILGSIITNNKDDKEKILFHTLRCSVKIRIRARKPIDVKDIENESRPYIHKYPEAGYFLYKIISRYEPDLIREMAYLEAAKKLNFGPAFLEIGLYCEKLGSMQQAIVAYKQAKKMGNVPAAIKLGFCYLRGNGVVLDTKKASQLFDYAKERRSQVVDFGLNMCRLEEPSNEKARIDTKTSAEVEKIKELDKTLGERLEKIVELSAKNAALKKANADKKILINQLEKDRADGAALIDKLNKDKTDIAAQLEKDKENVQRELIDLRKKYSSIMDSIAPLRNECNMYKTQALNSHFELNKLKHMASNLQPDLKLSVNEATALASELAIVKERLNEKRMESSDKDALITKLRDKIRILEIAIQKHKAALDHARQCLFEKDLIIANQKRELEKVHALGKEQKPQPTPQVSYASSIQQQSAPVMVYMQPQPITALQYADQAPQQQKQTTVIYSSATPPPSRDPYNLVYYKAI